jgi:hypothetical protein
LAGFGVLGFWGFIVILFIIICMPVFIFYMINPKSKIFIFAGGWYLLQSVYISFFDFLNIGTFLGDNDELSTFMLQLNMLEGVSEPRDLFDVICLVFIGVDQIFGFQGEGVAKLVSVIFGGLSIFFLMKIIEDNFKDKIPLVVVGFIIVTLPAAYYFSSGVRDSAIIFFNILLMYTLTVKRGRLHVIFIIVYLIFSLRFENGLFSLAVIGLYYSVYSEMNKIYKMFIIVSCAVLLCIYYDIFLDRFVYKMARYHDRIFSISDSGIGNVLRNLSFPFNFIFTGVAGYFGPFPATRLLDSVFIKMGSVDGFITVSGYEGVALSKLTKFMSVLSWQIINIYIFLSLFYYKRDWLLNKKIQFLLVVTVFYCMSVSIITLTYERFIVFTAIIYPVFVAVMVGHYRQNAFRFLILLCLACIVELTLFLIYMSVSK